ncbi:MAG: pirin family protein [Kofleriaceae bacterium]
MITIRRAAERGRANHGWLDSRHTFSFASYYDRRHMGFRALRVINDDRVAAGRGFGAHPHRDMEIISYVLEGTLVHKDSTGIEAVIRPGDVQRMTAGTGVMHSEYNGSSTDGVHFLQIWLMPDQRGVKPGYAQKTFSDADKRGRLALVASRSGEAGSITLHADARVYAGILATGDRARLELASGRGAWIHVARGDVRIGSEELRAGDGVAVEQELVVTLEGVNEGEILAFDLA